MGPKLLGAGFVLLQPLLLRVGLAGPRHNKDRCERKNRSIESRFHRVTPYAGARPAHVIYFEGVEGRTLWSVVRYLDGENLSHPMRVRSAACGPLAGQKQIERNFSPGTAIKTN